MTINEVSKLSGVTVRALQYYDKIGLLAPAKVKENGYRVYDGTSLETLQQILFFKELGFELSKIAKIMKDENFDRVEALKNHKKILELKANRLKDMILLTEKMIKGENNMSFKEFDKSEMEKHMKKYEKEVREKWGETDAYKQSTKKTSKYSSKDWKRVNEQAEDIFSEFIKLMESGSTKNERDEAVIRWRDFITESYYDCTDEIMLGLAEMYVNDPRFKKNLDEKKEGLAEYMSHAIKECFNGK